MKAPNVTGDAKLADFGSDLLKTLAHHDAEIISLGNRMGGVETSVRQLASDVNKGFTTIADRLSAFDSQRGPGLGSILGFVATGGAVVGMSAAAITVLVTSFVSPPITRLEGQVQRLTYYVDRREEVDRQDFIELRRATAKGVADDIQRLEKTLRQIETRAAASMRETTK